VVRNYNESYREWSVILFSSATLSACTANNVKRHSYQRGFCIEVLISTLCGEVHIYIMLGFHITILCPGIIALINWSRLPQRRIWQWCGRTEKRCNFFNMWIFRNHIVSLSIYYVSYTTQGVFEIRRHDFSFKSRTLSRLLHGIECQIDLKASYSRDLYCICTKSFVICIIIPYRTIPNAERTRITFYLIY